jgi:hypothetical protein
MQASKNPIPAAKTKRRIRSDGARLAPAKAGGKAEHTIVWGPKLETDYFLKVPKVLFKLGRHSGKIGKVIHPRHILLILALMSRQYKNKPVRVYWETLAVDLGVKADTVRRWAYQMRDAGYLRITQHRGRNPEKNQPGYRNESNSFDYSPFVRFVEKMREEEKAAKEKAKGQRR